MSNIDSRTSTSAQRRFKNTVQLDTIFARSQHSNAGICAGGEEQSSSLVRWTHEPVVRREAEKYWGNGVVLTRLLGIHIDGHAPSLEAAKAEFQASWRQWLAWAKL